MAFTNRTFTSFTITQPFLGAPLQFNPALGSKELEELIDAYVVGPASKQDKFSEVTIDFYNHAAVDLNTGSLVRHYNILPFLLSQSPWAFEQSPIQSQSSGFSPPMFTPSPASSIALGDSGYGSISSLAPPTRNRPSASRFSKKSKKETKKAAELRLPGFSIMTKDGVDVTSSAGRGTKTKEQREHAHLMRIMKACDACKKKKVRCDPSHRRSHSDMSRASTSTTNTYSPGRSDPSPTVSVPSLSREPTQSSQSSMPSFDTSNAIDDFVLFPDDTSSWNPADLPVAEDYDLSNFNFDINELTDFPQAGADQSFNFSSFDQLASNFPLVGQQQYTSSQPQNSMNYWEDPQLLMPVAHTRPHPTTTLTVSGQLDSTGWLQDVTTVSPRSSTNAAYGDHYWPDTRDQVQTSQVAVMNDSPSSFSSADWSVLELSINANISPQPDVSASPGSYQSSHSSRRSQQVEQAQLLVGTSTSHHVNEGIQEPAEQASLRRHGETGAGTVPSEPQVPEGGSISSLGPLTGGLHEYGQSHISRTTSGIPGEILGLADTCTLVSESLRNVRSAPTDYIALSGELQRLRTVLVQFQTGMADTTVLERLETYGTQLQVLRSRVKQIVLSGRLLHEEDNQQDTEYYVDFVRQCQVKARRFVRSLCSIINNLHTQESGSSPTNDDSSPNSGHNLPLFVSSSQAQIHGNHGYSLAPDIQVMDSSILSWQNSSRPSDVSGMDFSLRQGERLDEQDREVAYDLCGISAPEARSQHANSTLATLGVRDVPRYSLLVKTEAIAADLERLSPQTDINIQESLDANFVRLGDESAQASPSFNDYQQDTTAVHIFEDGSNSSSQLFPAVDYSSSLEEGILWSSRPRQVPLTSPTPIIVNLATTVSQFMDSSEDVAFAQTGGDSSLGAVSQATGEAARLPATNTEQDGIFRHVDIQQATIIASLPIIGLFLTAPSPIMSSILTYLLPLVALALFSPRENSMAWPPLPSVNVASIACLAPLARPSLECILFVREFCTEWTNTNSTFASIAKLVICAIIVAEAPAIFSKVFQSWNGHQIAVAIATSMISFFGDEMSADGSMCKGNKISFRDDLEKGSSESRSSYLLGMMRELSFGEVLA